MRKKVKKAEKTKYQCSPTSGCGAQLSLGHSDERRAAVAVEIRAAALATGAPSRKAERQGMSDHADHCNGLAYINAATLDNKREIAAGWLGRELCTHDEREERDQRAWDWDPRWPIAGQYEGRMSRGQIAWAAKQFVEPFDVEAAVNFVCDPSPLMMDAQELRAEQIRHDVAASVVRHAALSETSEASGEGASHVLVEDDSEDVPRTAAVPIEGGDGEPPEPEPEPEPERDTGVDMTTHCEVK